MSKKRTSAESNNDEQTNEGSESLFRKEDNAKRAKLDSLSDTTLQDLPIELLECILVKAVAMEVKGMKLAKSVWKEKADLVISRLRTVCSHWSSILTTKFFRNELHRALDDTAQTIRLEILHQSPIPFPIYVMTTLKDEILMACRPRGEDFRINVHDRNNIVEVKGVIPLPGLRPECMEACNVSNCVYVVLRRNDYSSVSRITKDEKHQFNISPWISDHIPKPTSLFVFPDGRVVILSDLYPATDALGIYDPNGSLQHEIMLSPDIDESLRFVDRVIPKSNGNLVLVSWGVETNQVKLLEINTSGTVVRQFLSSHSPLDVYVFYAGFNMFSDRIMITGSHKRMELLDSEFNLLEFSRSTQHGGQNEGEIGEILGIANNEDPDLRRLEIFRFTEE